MFFRIRKKYIVRIGNLKRDKQCPVVNVSVRRYSQSVKIQRDTFLDPSSPDFVEPPKSVAIGGNTQFLVFVCLVPSFLTFLMGCWQVQRYFRKKQMIKERVEKMKTYSIYNEEIRDNATLDHLYETVELEGQFLYDLQQLLGPRNSPNLSRQQGLGQTHLGYYILCPLQTRYGIVLINRGWIAEENLDKIPRDESKIAIRGVINREEKSPILNHQYFDQQTKRWLVNSPESIFIRLGIKDPPVLIDELSSSHGKSPLIQKKKLEDYVTFATMPETHIAYIITWWSFTLWGLGTAIYKRKKYINWVNYQRQKSQSFSAFQKRDDMYKQAGYPGGFKSVIEDTLPLKRNKIMEEMQKRYSEKKEPEDSKKNKF